MDDEQQHENEELHEAYARLATALAPPSDVLVRVERESAARRRRRRTAVAGATALVVAGAVGGIVVLGSGDSPQRDVVARDSPGDATGSFTLTLTDGSQVEFHDFTLSCDKTPNGDPPDPGHIYLWSPFQLDPSGKSLTQPYVLFQGIADQIDGQTYTLPVDNTGGQTGYPVALMFAAEADSGDEKRPNEVSSEESGAAGTLTVLRAACDPQPVLELRVDATLGSEVSQGTEKVVGSFG